MASFKGHTAVVKALLAHEATEVNQAATNDGSTPLCMASYVGHAAVVDALLRRSDVKMDLTMSNCNVSPLISAAAGGHQRCVELLLDAGADVGIAMTAAEEDIGGGVGIRALDLAKERGYDGIVALLTGGGSN
jgi:ankyrin repeat protein